MKSIFLTFTNIVLPLFYLLIAFGMFNETNKALKGHTYQKIIRNIVAIGFIIPIPFII